MANYIINMSLEEINNKLFEIKEKIKKVYKAHEMNDEQVSLSMIKLDSDFLMNAYVNGRMNDLLDPDMRLKYYVRYLELELKELKQKFMKVKAKARSSN